MPDMTRQTARADSPARVLLVDDVPANLLSLEAVLHELGAVLVKAGSGEEALRRLLAEDYAVILMDVRMPGLDGYETARLIHGRDRSRDVPIIFVTAHESPEEVVIQAYKDGAADHLVKPLVPEVLRAKVQRYLELARRAQGGKAPAAPDAQGLTAAVLDTMAGLVLVLDREGRVVRFNRACEGLTGYSFAEVGGRPVWDLQLFPEGEKAGARAAFDRLTAGQFPSLHSGYWVSKSGERRWIVWSNTALTGPAGRVELVVATGIDETERKRAEEALREADRRKDEFLAMLSHELRTPLAPIRNGLHVLRLTGGPGPAATALEMMDRQMQHLTRLVDDLLDVARLTRGKIRLDRRPVDLAEVVTRAVEAARPLVEARQHELTVSLPAGPLPLEADPLRLAQVLTNLLHNAAKFTPEGGRLTLSAVVAGAEVVVRVRDNGVGIPAAVLPHVFELFAQADQPLDRSEGGLGVGLTLARSLVEMHGGSVAAHSDGPGRGSEFVVRLPLREGPGPGAGPAGEERGTAPGARRVLVVDDNRDAAESLAMLLRATGHEVRTAHAGPAALEAARAHRPEVVLLDIGLPGLDGYEVARRLRAEPGFKGALLVALTGYGQDEDRRRSQAAGFDLHLVKPVDLATLQDALSRAGAGRA
jgi:PAS domain S-box-containing protein